MQILVWKNCAITSCIVGNKAKEQISKWLLQKNKARQIFRKNKHFLPTYVCVSADKKCLFFEKFDGLCFLETPVLRIALLPSYRRYGTMSDTIKIYGILLVHHKSLELILYGIKVFPKKNNVPGFLIDKRF